MTVRRGDSAPMGVDEFVHRFGKHVDAGAAVVFVGAGLSQRAGYPSWDGLVDTYATQLGIDVTDFPLLVQYFEDNITGGRATVRSDVELAIRKVKAVPAECHRLLGKLPIREIWTSNYDPIIEMAIPGLDVIIEDEELAEPRPPGGRLCKMNGSIDGAKTSRELVLSRDQFEKYSVTHPRFLRLLEASFLTRSFLFLGFSLSDPNILQVFRLVRAFTPDIQREHFTITKPPDELDKLREHELRRTDFARVGVRVVEVSDHGQLDNILRRLVARCRPGRAYISGSYLGSRGPTNPTSYPTAPAQPVADKFADALGRRFADTEAFLMAGGEVGARVGYEMCRRCLADGRYSADRFILLRRHRDQPLDSPNLRLGSVRFTTNDADPLRAEALDNVRAIVVIGGTSGTADEVSRALREGLGVIPVGHTGGTARSVWEEMKRSLATYKLGERDIDSNVFDLLNSPDADIAAEAAVGLALQALFLT